MLKIRLQRVGRKNFPSFRIVLAEHTRPVKGRFLEILGFYNSMLKQRGLKKDRIKYWLSMGVKLSPTIHNLFIDEKIIDGKKVGAWKSKKKIKEAAKPGGIKPAPAEAKIEDKKTEIKPEKAQEARASAQDIKT